MEIIGDQTDYHFFQNFNEKLNKQLEKVYIYNIKEKERCPVCNSRRLKYHYFMEGYRCDRCGSIISKNRKEIKVKRIPPKCPICKSSGSVSYRVKTKDYRCDRCKFVINQENSVIFD